MKKCEIYSFFVGMLYSLGNFDKLGADVNDWKRCFEHDANVPPPLLHLLLEETWFFVLLQMIFHKFISNMIISEGNVWNKKIVLRILHGKALFYFLLLFHSSTLYSLQSWKILLSEYFGDSIVHHPNPQKAQSSLLSISIIIVKV
mgnify:CR=1 FL=1